MKGIFFSLKYMKSLSLIMKFHGGVLNINSGGKLALPGQQPQIAGSTGRVKTKHNQHCKPNAKTKPVSKLSNILALTMTLL